ncbi:hypothetical protein E2C01_037512 [Portunus trituberculatus]|uniref:Uncharacterized protein n=1 Tax=Portunus trituberculatus TaxID=210409 RepID=A0A5B7FE64_PORTR|nr:hypothetical protein [Portunus trituberculatus]
MPSTPSSFVMALDTAVTRLRIGHTRLNAHLHRLGMTESPHCPFCCYAVAEALRKHFGSMFQAEVYQEQLKGWMHKPSESLTQLAQTVESLVWHAYPVT